MSSDQIGDRGQAVNSGDQHNTSVRVGEHRDQHHDDGDNGFKTLGKLAITALASLALTVAGAVIVVVWEHEATLIKHGLNMQAAIDARKFSELAAKNVERNNTAIETVRQSIDTMRKEADTRAKMLVDMVDSRTDDRFTASEWVEERKTISRELKVMSDSLDLLKKIVGQLPPDEFEDAVNQLQQLVKDIASRLKVLENAVQ